MNIRTLFSFIILLSNTLFQDFKSLTDQYIPFNNAKCWQILLHIISCEYVDCHCLQIEIAKIWALEC